MKANFMELCFVVLVMIGMAYASSCGQYTATDGTSFELDGLTKPQSIGYQLTQGSYTYFFNLCDNYVTTQTTTYCYANAPVYQISTTQLCYLLGALPPTITDGINGPGTGVTIKYTNENDRCQFGTIPRVVNINVKCGAAEKVLALTEPTTCFYDIVMESPHACPKKSADSLGKIGLSPGSIFLIVLLVAVVVYLVGGAVFRYKFQEVEPGVNLIPNLPFWILIPGLVKDGCVFTFDKIKALVSRN